MEVQQLTRASRRSPSQIHDDAMRVLSHLVMSTTPPAIPAGQSFAPPTLQTLTFIGTGSDLLSFSANTNLGEWYLSEVSAVATTPIPAALPLFVSALTGLGVIGWRRRQTASPLIRV